MNALVIGNDHYNTLNVVRALGKEGIIVSVVIETTNRNSFVLTSKYANNGFIVGKLDADWLIKTFATTQERIPVIATSDAIASFIDDNYTKLSSFFILPSVGEKEGGLTRMMDKNIQLAFAKEVGFDVPKSIAINIRDYDYNDIENCNFPCIIKPEESIGGSKNDFRICNNIDNLEHSLQELSDHVSRVLVQDYIPNDEVILVAGIRTIDGRNYVFGEVNKTKHGRDLNNLGLNALGILNPESEIASLCRNFTDSIDYHGLYSVEAVRKRTASTLARRQNYFMEINLRSDGLLYFYTAANINFPAAWIRSCYGEDVKLSANNKSVIGMNEFLYFRKGFSTSLIKDIFKTNVFSLFSIKDPKPFIYKFLYHKHD